MKISNEGKTCRDCSESMSYIDLISQEETWNCCVFDDHAPTKPDKAACDYFLPKVMEVLSEDKLLKLAEKIRTT